MLCRLITTLLAKLQEIRITVVISSKLVEWQIDGMLHENILPGFLLDLLARRGARNHVGVIPHCTLV